MLASIEVFIVYLCLLVECLFIGSNQKMEIENNLNKWCDAYQLTQSVITNHINGMKLSLYHMNAISMISGFVLFYGELTSGVC